MKKVILYFVLALVLVAGVNAVLVQDMPMKWNLNVRSLDDVMVSFNYTVHLNGSSTVWYVPFSVNHSKTTILDYNWKSRVSYKEKQELLDSKSLEVIGEYDVSKTRLTEERRSQFELGQLYKFDIPAGVTEFNWSIGESSTLIEGSADDEATQPGNTNNVFVSPNGTMYIAYRNSNSEPELARGSSPYDSFENINLTIALGSTRRVQLLVYNDSDVEVIHSYQQAGPIHGLGVLKSTDGGTNWIRDEEIFDWQTGFGDSSDDFFSCWLDNDLVRHCVATNIGQAYYENSTSKINETINDNIVDDTDLCDGDSFEDGTPFVVCAGTDGDDLDAWSPLLNGWGDTSRSSLRNDSSFDPSGLDHNIDVKIRKIGGVEYIFVVDTIGDDLWVSNSTKDQLPNFNSYEWDASSSKGASLSIAEDGRLFILYHDAGDNYLANSSALNVTGYDKRFNIPVPGTDPEHNSVRDASWPEFNRMNTSKGYEWYVYTETNGNDVYLNNFTVTPSNVVTDLEVPGFFNVSVFPATGASYVNGADYNFSSAWVDDIGVDVVVLWVNGTKYSAVNSWSNTWNFTLYDLAAGDYSYFWNGSDASGRWNVTGNLTFTVAKAVPSGNVTSSAGFDIVYGEGTVIGSEEDNYGDSDVSYDIYRDDVLVGGGSVNLSAGNYTYTLNSTEGENYTASGLFSGVLNVSKAVPALFLSFDPSQNVGEGLQSNVSGGGCPDQISCSLYRDGVLVSNPDVQTLANGEYDYVWNTSGDGNYTGFSVSGQLNISPDLTPPVISFESFINGTIIVNSTMVNVSAFELETSVDLCVIQLDGGANTTMHELNNSFWNISYYELNNGNHTFNIHCNNTNGNTSTTFGWLNFSQDVNAPLRTINSPTNGTTLPSITTSVVLNISTNEVSTCRYIMGGDADFDSMTEFTTTNGVLHLETESVSQGNTYEYYYRCNDTVGNVNDGSTYHTFSVAGSIAPNVTLVSPSNGLNSFDTSMSFVYTPEDDEGIFNKCELYTNRTGTWSISTSSTSINNGSQNTLSLSELSNSSIIWNVKCEDSLGLQGFSPNNRTLHISIIDEDNTRLSIQNISGDEVAYIDSKGDGFFRRNLEVAGTTVTKYLNVQNASGNDLLLVDSSTQEFGICKNYENLENGNGSYAVLKRVGGYQGSANATYRLKIDTAPGSECGQARFNYSTDDTDTWIAENVITDCVNPISLEGGFFIYFEPAAGPDFIADQVYRFSAFANVIQNDECALLVDTVDDNIASRLPWNHVNQLNVTSLCINGDCAFSGSDFGGNPFDQSLNTTDNVTFTKTSVVRSETVAAQAESEPYFSYFNGIDGCTDEFLGTQFGYNIPIRDCSIFGGAVNLQGGYGNFFLIDKSYSDSQDPTFLFTNKSIASLSSIYHDMETDTMVFDNDRGGFKFESSPGTTSIIETSLLVYETVNASEFNQGGDLVCDNSGNCDIYANNGTVLQLINSIHDQNLNTTNGVNFTNVSVSGGIYQGEGNYKENYMYIGPGSYQIYVDGNTFPIFDAYASGGTGSIELNANGDDVDIYFTEQGGSPKLQFESSTGFLSVGGTNPKSQLDIKGNTSVRGNLTVSQEGSFGDKLWVNTDSPLNVPFYVNGTSWTNGMAVADKMNTGILTVNDGNANGNFSAWDTGFGGSIPRFQCDAFGGFFKLCMFDTNAAFMQRSLTDDIALSGHDPSFNQYFALNYDVSKDQFGILGPESYYIGSKSHFYLNTSNSEYKFGVYTQNGGTAFIGASQTKIVNLNVTNSITLADLEAESICIACDTGDSANRIRGNQFYRQPGVTGSDVAINSILNQNGDILMQYGKKDLNSPQVEFSWYNGSQDENAGIQFTETGLMIGLQSEMYTNDAQEVVHVTNATRFDTNVSIAGDLNIQQNFTMRSENGTRFSCEISNAGVISCV